MIFDMPPWAEESSDQTRTDVLKPFILKREGSFCIYFLDSALVQGVLVLTISDQHGLVRDEISKNFPTVHVVDDKPNCENRGFP